MNSLFVSVSGNPYLFTDLTSQTPEQILNQLGVTDPSQYAEFNSADFDPACYAYSGAFTLVDGVVGFDLDTAKSIGESIVNQQSNEQAKKNLEGLSYDVYVAQCSIPAEQRIVKYQAAIDANNALAVETENREQAVYAATTIQEVNAIVYPPKD